MTEVPSPDWAALYQKHRDAMYRVAATTLRSAGRQDEAEDAVMAAVQSLMKAPPSNVRNWEAMLVRVTKRRALDMLCSAVGRRESVGINYEHDVGDATDVGDDVAEHVDEQRDGAVLRDSLATLDPRHRQVLWEFVGKQRSRGDVAAELGVTPGRISQIAAEGLRQLHSVLHIKGVER